jgi:hypothetical protein
MSTTTSVIPTLLQGMVEAERYPDAPEYSAVVLPETLGPFVKQLVFFDEARTRRVVYPGPIQGIEQELPPVDEALINRLIIILT